MSEYYDPKAPPAQNPKRKPTSDAPVWLPRIDKPATRLGKSAK